MSTTPDQLREEVRRRYAESALAVTSGTGCGCGSGSCCETGEAVFGVLGLVVGGLALMTGRKGPAGAAVTSPRTTGR